MIKNKTNWCHKCKAKDLKKKSNKKDWHQGDVIHREEKRIAQVNDPTLHIGVLVKTTLISTVFFFLPIYLNYKILKWGNKHIFIKVVVPATGQHALWCLASLLCTGVASLCYDVHREKRQSRSHDHATVEWHWQRWFVSHIWHRQSHGSDHWSSSWAGTPRVNPQCWTKESARPRRYPVEYEWWRLHNGLLELARPTLMAEWRWFATLFTWSHSNTWYPTD